MQGTNSDEAKESRVHISENRGRLVLQFCTTAHGSTDADQGMAKMYILTLSFWRFLQSCQNSLCTCWIPSFFGPLIRWGRDVVGFTAVQAGFIEPASQVAIRVAPAHVAKIRSMGWNKMLNNLPCSINQVSRRYKHARLLKQREAINVWPTFVPEAYAEGHTFFYIRVSSCGPLIFNGTCFRVRKPRAAYASCRRWIELIEGNRGKQSARK